MARFLNLLVFAIVLALPARDSAAQRWPEFQSSLQPAQSSSPVVSSLLPDIAVTPPGAEVPAAKASLSGKWSGWASRNRVVDLKLAVETVTATGATIVYAIASEQIKPLATRIAATFNGDELVGRLAGGEQIIFRLRPDGHLDFLHWVAANRWMSGILHKEGTELAAAQCGDVSRERVSFERMDIPRVVDDRHDKGSIALVTYLYRPKSGGRLPVVIFNHGSTGGQRISPKLPMHAPCAFVRHFTEQGFAVASPNRRGRGESGGTLIEECPPGPACRHYLVGVDGLEDAVRDLDAVIEHVSRLDFVDPQRIWLAGQSRGGFLSVIYAGRRPDKIKAVISFAGGWFGVRAGHPGEYAQYHATMLATAGQSTRSPMLWVYRDNDSYYETPAIRQFHDSFTTAGGRAALHVLAAAPGADGHNLLSEPNLWLPLVRDFSAQVK